MAAEDRIDGYASAILEFATAEDQLERVGDEPFRIARLPNPPRRSVRRSPILGSPPSGRRVWSATSSATRRRRSR